MTDRMQPDSVDAVVCDPPYEIGFMGKSWDRAGVAFDKKTWASVLRVLKPGAHMLVMGGTRTYHRMACAVEDAGFEIRDCLMYMYGSGFPKSLNVSKAIDKAAGAERDVVGVGRAGQPSLERVRRVEQGYRPNLTAVTPESFSITVSATDDAQRWDGWGTALKPAYEPIVLARKPLDKKSVASNVLAHGTGAINVDASRISLNGDYKSKPNGRPSQTGLGDNYDPEKANKSDNVGRWPANVLLSHSEECVLVGSRTVKGDPRDTGNGTRPGGFAQVGKDPGSGEPNAPVYGDSEIDVYECASDCPVAILDEQTSHLGSGGDLTGDEPTADGFSGVVYGDGKTRGSWQAYGDRGGASRFFYTSKVSRKERNWGVECKHTTMKPISLMRYLVRLITPPGGVILDPFMGSGSTLIAAALEGFDSIGIEKDDENFDEGRRRVEFWAENGPPS